MKKLLLLPALLLTINLGAATTEQTTEVTKATIEKESPSFLVRHANKLKIVAYATDIVFPLAAVSSLLANYIDQDEDESTLKKTYTAIFLIATIFCKAVTDPVAKYAMSKKIAELEKGSQEQTAAEQQ